MGINLGDVFPNFSAESTSGTIQFHEWLAEDKWAILFSHPADFTPVCTTELSEVNKYSGEFENRGVKLIALSCDSVDSHKSWTEDIESFKECGKLKYPIIADPKRELAVQLGMIDPDEKDAAGLPLTCRAVFIIGPGRKLKLSMLYPATTGRNFNEILRVVDSLQLTVRKKVATPANWKSGDKCMVIPSLSDDEANKLFASGFEKIKMPSGKSYMRFTADPSDK
ncbi:Peroxiredoxin-6 [Mactra antiquata]